MKREIIVTSDGSTTIRLPELDECYHSKHGAVQEAYHVFIKNGLSGFEGRPLSILEIGFGTGLNAFITFLEAQKTDQQIFYTGVEAYPVAPGEAAMMNYPSALNAGNQAAVFEKMHESPCEEAIQVSENFKLTKSQLRFEDIEFSGKFDLIYFNAFGFRVQPELWSADIFKRMYNALKENGVLVTYAARSVIKKNMLEAGFTVEKLPGPPGKREMMRAVKVKSKGFDN